MLGLHVEQADGLDMLLQRSFPEYRLTSSEAEYTYVSVLRNKFGWKDVPDLANLTSGIHLLYMSALLAGGVATAANMNSIAKPTWPLWLFATLVALAGFLLDRRAERMETALLFGADDVVIRTALAHAFPNRAQALPPPLQAKYSASPPLTRPAEVALEHLRTVALVELAPHLRILADRVNEHRLKNDGLTPKQLFVQCLELGLTYTCIELVIWVQDDHGNVCGVVLKRRDRSDQGWHGKLTISGVALRPFDTLIQAQEHLLQEIASNENLRAILRSAFAMPVYLEVHREDTDATVEGRRVNCLTAVYSHSIPKSAMLELQPGFEYIPVTDIAIDAIVDHHRATLASLLRSRVASSAA